MTGLHTKDGVVGQYDEGSRFWVVRYGPGIADVQHLRGVDFDSPPSPGMEVTLEYRTTPTSGLWHARRKVNP